MQQNQDLILNVGEAGPEVYPLFPRLSNDPPLSARSASLKLKLWPGRGGVVFAGYRPLEETRLPALVAQAARLGYGRRSILCDADGLDRHDLAAKLKKAGLTLLLTPLLGPDGRVHDAITGLPGSFDALVTGLAAAREAGLPIACLLVPCADNVSTLPAMAALARELGAAQRTVLYPDPASLAGNCLSLLPDDEDLSRAIGHLLAAEDEGLSVRHLPYAVALRFVHESLVDRPDAQAIEQALAGRLAAGSPPACYLPARCEKCWLKPHCHEAIHTTDAMRHSQAREVINLVLNSDCRNRCVFCTFRNMDPEDAVYPHTPLEEIEAEMAKGINMGGKKLVFVGTEPLEYGNLPAIVARARELGYQEVAIQTHGEDLEDRGRLDALKAAGLTEVRMGVYGSTAAIHDAVAQAPGSYARVWRAMENLKAARMAFKLHTTVCRLNMDDLAGLELSLKRQGLGLHEYKLVAPFTRDLDRYRQVVPPFTELLGSVAAQYRRHRLMHRRTMEELLLRVSHNLVPPCVLLRVRQRTGVPFAVLRPEGEGPSLNGYTQLQMSIKNLNADYSLNQRFLTMSKHDIKTAVTCPHRDVCHLGAVCPGIYLDYARAYSMAEFMPVSPADIDGLKRRRWEHE